MDKKAFIAIAVAVAGAAVVLAIPGTEWTRQESEAPAGTPRFTLERVAEHAAPGDCWQVIGGKVYDLTPYVASGVHPGGNSIVSGCGTDATALFQKAGHTEQAKAYLPNFYIGDVAPSAE